LEDAVRDVAVVGDVGGAGHDRNRNAAGPQLAEQRAAVLTADVDVEQDDVGSLRGERFLGLSKGFCLGDGESVQLEVDADQHAQSRVIVDDERLGRGRLHRAATLTTTIDPVTAQTGTEELYAEELGELWTDLRRTLTRLDGVAADPDVLDDFDAPASLR